MTPAHTGPSPKKVMLVAVLAAVAAAGYAYRDDIFGKAAPADKSDQIAAVIGASSCSQTRYTLIDKITNDSAPIYDCLMKNLATKCVTYEHGIANDSTEEVRLVFATTLGSDRPECLTTGG